MKKNFFKKLSFVMALAMIISVVAPAAGAFAATSPALNTTSKTMLLGNEDRSEYDFNVSHKQAGSTYKWTSSKTSVATVNAKNGFTTAVGVGKTTVTVVITKSGKTLATLSAKVTVKDNIAAITSIYSQTADADLAKLAVGTDYDFGRKFTTESGSTSKTTSVTRWTVSSTDATINDAGVFNAAKAGTYTITAVAFQSKAKYAAWVAAGSDVTSGLVLASKTLDVTAVYSIKEVKQVSTTKFTVTFNADMTDTDVTDESVLSKVINGKNVVTGAEKLKTVTLDATGKVLTVTTYTDLTSEAAYGYSFGDLTASFTAAKVALSEVKTIAFNDFAVEIASAASYDVRSYVVGVDKDGVIIYDGATSTALFSYLTFTYDGDSSKGALIGYVPYLYAVGNSAVLTAKYSNYLFDAATSTYTNVTASDSATVTGVAKSIDNTSIQFAVTNIPVSSTTTWGTSATIAAKDMGYSINARYHENFGTNLLVWKAATSEFTYTSSDTDKLIITGTTLYPVSAGVVTVIVKSATAPFSVVSTFDITITAERAFVTAPTGSLTAGNTSFYSMARTTATFTDSLGSALIPTTVGGATLVSGPVGSAPSYVFNMSAGAPYANTYLYFFNTVGATPGVYTFVSNVTALGTTKQVYITVNVLDGTGVYATVANWKLDIVDANGEPVSAVDLKSMTDAKNLTAKVIGYNALNVKVDELLSTEFNVVVKNSAGITTGSSSTIPVIAATGAGLSVTGTPILVAIPVGAYSVTASLTGTALSHASLSNRAIGSYIAGTSFTVSNSTSLKSTLVAPFVPVASVSTIYGLVTAAYDFTLNGVAITDTNITKINYVAGGVALSSAGTAPVAAGVYYITSIEYTVLNATTATVYTYTLGNSVTVQ